MNYNTKKVWVNTDYKKSETHLYSNVSECCDRIANSYKDSIVFIAEWHVKQLLAEKDAEIERLKQEINNMPRGIKVKVNKNYIPPITD